MAKINCGICGHSFDEELARLCPECDGYLCDECSDLYEGYCQECFDDFNQSFE